MVLEDHVPAEVRDVYDVHDYRHAAAILAGEFPTEFKDVCRALLRFRFTEDDVKEPGGNESAIPKNFSKLLRPLGWEESNLKAERVVDGKTIAEETHKIDYIKSRVALDLEWNSKDQTFDRDLYAFRAFFEYDRISVGILITRSLALDPWIASLGSYKDKHGVVRTYSQKYGASTTHVGKLLPRLNAGRGGGCPVLVFGITPRSLKK
jgi:hypothetical protein